MKLKLKLTAMVAALALVAHRIFHRDEIVLANTLVTTLPNGQDTKFADEAIGRYTLVKAGSDEDHIGVCDSGDVPLGMTGEDSATAAEASVGFEYFGAAKGTRQATASGAITRGQFLVPADNGALRDLPAGAGTYYIVGRALNAPDDGEIVHFVPCFPIQRVVAG
jgi:hypothetical protein